MLRRISSQTASVVSNIIIAISALLGSVALVILAVSVQNQREFNHCLANLDSKWRHSVGLGLVAVSEGNDVALEHHAKVISRLSQEEC